MGEDPRFPREPKPEDTGEVGIMTREHTVWCGRCQKWAQYPGEKREVTASAKLEGWSYTKERGWRCRSCTAKTKVS